MFSIFSPCVCGISTQTAQAFQPESNWRVRSPGEASSRPPLSSSVAASCPNQKPNRRARRCLAFLRCTMKRSCCLEHLDKMGILRENFVPDRSTGISPMSDCPTRWSESPPSCFQMVFYRVMRSLTPRERSIRLTSSWLISFSTAISSVTWFMVQHARE